MNAADTHRRIARKHAIKRCRERYNIDLKPRDLAALEARIRSGEGEVLRRLPGGRLTVRIRFLFDHLPVTFDPSLDCIVTVLPRDCREMLAREQGRG